MKFVPFFLILFVVFVVSCNKKTGVTSTEIFDSSISIQPDKKPDYIFLPTKDAKWYMYYQGANNPASGMYDTNYHFYSMYEATGRDTIIDDKSYYIYMLTIHSINTARNIDDYTYGYVYALLDTLNNKIDYLRRIGNTNYPIRSVNFNMAEYVDKKPCFLGGPISKSIVVSGDSIQIDGHKTDALYMMYEGQKYFYFSKGIGGVGVFDVCPYFDIAGAGGKIRSLSFRYKSDSLHFDYPFVYY